MKKILLTFLLLSIVTLTSVYAQSRKITGTVIGADDGKPLPGVSVKITGTNLGVQTNVQGAFSLTAASGATTLTFSYLGYLPQTVKITGTTINVSLAPDSRSLNEVVVTGYGVEKKREITGAISSIKGSDFADQPVQTLDRAIQGRAAGVQVTSTGGGQPGGGIAVQIRGVATVTGNTQPLYIIDGVQLNTGGNGANNASISGNTSVDPLSSINPDDVESIEILKDAASAAIYGALAANGVVLITTKHGKSGKTQVNASVQIGRAQPYNPYKTLTSAQWIQLQQDGFDNVATRTNASVAAATAAAIASYSAAFPGGVVPAVVPTYDWVKAINRTGDVSQYDLSISGGDAKTTFFISGSYNNTGGTIINSLFQRGTLRGSITNAISDKFSVVASFSLTGSNILGSTATQGFFTNAPFTGAQLTPPVNPIYNPDGTFNQALVGRNAVNIVQNTTQEQIVVGTMQTVDNLALIYKIIPGLSFKAFGGLDFSDVHGFDYRPATILAVAGAVNGSGSENYNRNINYNTSGTFNFSKTIGDHSLSAIAGFEFRSVTNNFLSASATGFPSPLFTLIGNASTPTVVNSTFTGYNTAGFLGSLSYKYKDKYFFTLNGRDDGSSRFGANNKYGLFYGASAGWEITREDFMKNATFVTQLKPRASYGVVGELPTANFGSLALYTGVNNLANANNPGQYAFNSVGIPGGVQGALALTQLPVPNLSWERSAQADIGLDFGFFNGRLSGSLDVYRKTNTGLILNQQVPGDTGFTGITENSGSARSEGYDVLINTINIDKGGFKWVTSFNLGFNRTKLLSLYNGVQQIFIGNPNGNGTTSLFQVGQPLNLIYAPKWAGVNPADGRGMYYDIHGNLTYNPKTADQFILGQNNPAFTGGLTNTISYKGLSLDFLFQYQYGNASILQAQANSYENLSNVDNKTVDVLTRWTAPGQITTIPRAYNGTEPLAASQGTLSSRFVDIASYIRLKEATLNYTLPKSFTQHIGVGALTVFVQGLNLLTFTNYRGNDPENTGTNLQFYPNERTITAGIKAKF